MLALVLIACTPAVVHLGDGPGRLVDPVDDTGTVRHLEPGGFVPHASPGDSADTGPAVDSEDSAVDDTAPQDTAVDTGPADTAVDDTGTPCGPLTAPAVVQVSNAADFATFAIGGCDVDVRASCADSFAAVYPPDVVDGPTPAEAWIIDWAYVGPDETRCTIAGASSSVTITVRVGA